MVEMIENSRHFIYLENQFFISAFAGGGVKNKVGAALEARLSAAIASGDRHFRVIVVLPAYPEGDHEGCDVVKSVMDACLRTLCLGDDSLVGRLRTKFPGVDVWSHLSMYALRTWGWDTERDRLVTEQVYVHDKVMIVDDCIAMVGSANINDRSLSGDRDTELVVVISGGTQVPSIIGGKPCDVSATVYSLRIALWERHLGVRHMPAGQARPYTCYDPSSAAGGATIGVEAHRYPLPMATVDLRDVCDDRVYRGVWMDTALCNTDFYETNFPATRAFAASAINPRPPSSCQWGNCSIVESLSAAAAHTYGAPEADGVLDATATAGATSIAAPQFFPTPYDTDAESGAPAWSRGTLVWWSVGYDEGFGLETGGGGWQRVVMPKVMVQ
jgi:hypothetical protein